MRRSDFQTGFPGELVRTEFDEPVSGRVVPSQGLAFVPSSLPPKLDWAKIIARVYPLLDHVRANLVRLEGKIEALPGRTLLLSAVRTREAQASSRIENTIASIQDVAIGGADRRQAHPQAMEVLRNRLAIEKGLASNLPISCRLVRDMHEVLVTDPRHTPGRFRISQVCIGDESRRFDEARFVPPPADRLDACLRDWELFCNPNAPNAPERERFPYFMELALAHYQFETIHPFSDGNGRLGRALVTVAPVKDGELRHPVCNLSEWIQSNRQEYYDRLLRVSTHAEWEHWIAFFCRALAEQAKLDTERTQQVSALYHKYFNLIAQRRTSALRIRLLDHLFEHLATTIPEAMRVLDVTYPTAKKHVEALVEAGVLEPLDARAYDKLYIARDVIRAIEGDAQP